MRDHYKTPKMKILSIITLLSLLCTIFTFPLNTLTVRASGKGVVIVVGQATAEKGELVVIPIKLESNPGIAGIILNIEYDSTRLCIDNANSVSRNLALLGLSYIGVDRHTYAQNPFRVIWFGATNDNSTGVMLNIKFRVLENAPVGEAFIRVFLEDDAVNLNLHPIPVSIQQGNVKIVANDVSETQPPTSIPTPQPITPTPNPETEVSQNPVEPKKVEIYDLPEEVINITEGNDVFVAEKENNIPVRELMSIPFNKEFSTISEAIIIYQIDLNGQTNLVIPSLYDEATSSVRYLGYTGELYMVDFNYVDFNDVQKDEWFHKAISFVAARGLFSGIGNNLFDPHSKMTRAMFVTVLSRLEGVNESLYYISPFDDVNIDNWYGPAIAWASQIGLINDEFLSGINNEHFHPYDNIKREEMAVLFSNYLNLREFQLEKSNTLMFDDIVEASEWTREAIQLIRSYSIVQGVGGNLYNPKSEATRAEVAQIFTNLVRAIVGLS
jgi:hypothetical protein